MVNYCSTKSGNGAVRYDTEAPLTTTTPLEVSLPTLDPP